MELSCAAKDISNAGLIGTISIMMENSNKGADIFLDQIPKPDRLHLNQWLLCFQSYGFILAVPPKNTPQVIDCFSERHITAKPVGRVTEVPIVQLISENESVILFDFRHDQITGFKR